MDSFRRTYPLLSTGFWFLVSRFKIRQLAYNWIPGRQLVRPFILTSF